METFGSWITSQSGVSLLVSLVALVGVITTTWWNNKKADERRERDHQDAENRRNAEDARREKERKEAKQLEDWTRQRHAVADCTSAIFTASLRVSEVVARLHRDKPACTMDELLAAKAAALNYFYAEAGSLLNQCDFEVTHPIVSEHIHLVWSVIENEARFLNGSGSTQSGDDWLAKAKNAQALSEAALKELRALTVVTRLALLQYPEKTPTEKVEPVEVDE